MSHCKANLTNCRVFITDRARQGTLLARRGTRLAWDRTLLAR